jgi:hypothetical protein
MVAGLPFLSLVLRREENEMTAADARVRARKGHIAEKATIDHLIRSLSFVPPGSGRVLAATTETGLTIQDQFRKTWNPIVIGLVIR